MMASGKINTFESVAFIHVVRRKGSVMLLIRKDIVMDVLRAMRRNQRWLGQMMGYGDAHMSRCLNNQSKLSQPFVSAILGVLHVPYDELFYDDHRPDTREFFGEIYVVNGTPMKLSKYKDYLNRVKHEHERESAIKLS